MLWLPKGHADTLDFSSERIDTNQLKPPKISRPQNKKPIEIEFGYGLRSYQSSEAQFFRSDADPEQREWTFSVQSHPGVEGGGFDIENLYQQKEGENYFKPSEAYYKWVGPQQSQIYFGRKLMPWSQADRLWRRGLFESRFLDQPLDDRVAGLTGLFWVTRPSSEHQWMFFASGLHVPEFGARAKVVNGKITSSNPWFRPPPSTVILNNQELDMQYRIQSPDIESVIFQPSLALSYQHASASGVTWQMSSAYKPAHQLLLEVPFLLNLSDSGEEIGVEADVVPQVQFHQVSSVSVSYDWTPAVVVWGEWTYDRPIQEDFNSRSITQSRADASIWTGTLEFRPAQLTNGWPVRSWISYSRLLGGEGEDKGEFASETSIFERRHQFQDAVQVGFQSQVQNFKSGPLQIVTKALYDHGQRGGILSAELTQSLRNGWRWALSADAIGKIQDEAPVQDGFTGLFRSNDRVGLEVGYVF